MRRRLPYLTVCPAPCRTIILVLGDRYLESPSKAPPLRIGLLADTPVLLACFAEMLGHIQASNFARLEMVVYNGDEPGREQAAQPHKSMVRKAADTLRDKKRRRRLLYTLYERWDRKQVAESQDPLRPVDCSEMLRGVDSLTVTPITKRFVHRFPPEAIERIREKNLDVLIRFGFNILRGEILQSARYGVWSYHHGDNDFYRGGPPYFWEVYEGNPTSGTILQVLTEELDGGHVLCKGYFATQLGISCARNRVEPYWGSSTFLIQKLQQLHGGGWERVESEMVPPAPYRGKTKIYTAPTNWQMVRWLAPALLRMGAQKAWQTVRGSRAADASR